jgi:thiol:disulfide interchange protein DsbA
MKKLLLALIGTLALTVACFASSGALALDVDRDFELVNPPQPTEVNGKVEVIEFFSYACPHCADFDPVLAKWVKGLPKTVVFRRVPVVFRPQWEAPALLYLTLEAMGEADRLHSSAFAAVQGQRLLTEPAVTAWAKSQGVDAKKFSDVYHSFTVQSKMQRSKQMVGAYGVRGVPTLVVGGKYRNASRDDDHPNAAVPDHEGLLKVVDGLIAKVRSEQK